MIKKCSKCFLEKSVDEFANDKYQKDGKTPSCKVCRSLRTAEWRRQNPDKDKAYKQSEAGRKTAREGAERYRQKHPDRVEAYHKSERGREVSRNARKRYYYKNTAEENRKFREYYYKNYDKERARRFSYYKSHAEQEVAYNKRKYPERKQYFLDWIKKDQKENPGKWNARNAKRRAHLIQRTPKWANLEKIQEFYENTPDGYVVDHVIPLQGKNVSGLHVENNLQYLTKSENCSKSNKFI